MEADLQAAHRLARSSRAQLAAARAEVGANLGIARSQRRRQGLSAILGTLQQLAGVSELHGALQCAPSRGRPAPHGAERSPAGGFRATEPLAASVGRSREERMHAQRHELCVRVR